MSSPMIRHTGPTTCRLLPRSPRFRASTPIRSRCSCAIRIRKCPICSYRTPRPPTSPPISSASENEAGGRSALQKSSRAHPSARGPGQRLEYGRDDVPAAVLDHLHAGRANHRVERQVLQHLDIEEGAEVEPDPMELRTVRPRDDVDPREELLHQARREFDAAVAVAREAA